MVKRLVLYSAMVLSVNSIVDVQLVQARDQESSTVDFWADNKTKAIMGMMDSMLQINPVILARIQKTGSLIREKRKVMNVRGTHLGHTSFQDHCSVLLAPINGFFDDISKYKESLRPLIMKSVVEDEGISEKDSFLIKYINSKDSLAQFCEKYVTTREIFLDTCNELEKLFSDLIKNVSEKTMTMYKQWAKAQSDQAARREKNKSTT